MSKIKNNKEDMRIFNIYIKKDSPRYNDFPNGIILTCYGEERAKEFCERNKDYFYVDTGKRFVG